MDGIGSRLDKMLSDEVRTQSPLLPADAGVWVSLDDGLFGPSTLIRRAQAHGFKISLWDEVDAQRFEAMAFTPDQSDRVIALADQADNYLNTIVPSGLQSEWINFELVLAEIS